jgi:catechol 2,3-dioxygenase-like lactoylglutathione lyase family enzyme
MMWMHLRRLAWLGVRASEYEKTVRFFRNVMGMNVEFDGPTTTELSLPNGDRVQIFSPGDRFYDHFGKEATGPVALFEVDDVHRARAELEAAGIELVGPVESDGVWRWIAVRAPDGNLYEFASRMIGPA